MTQTMRTAAAASLGLALSLAGCAAETGGGGGDGDGDRDDIKDLQPAVTQADVEIEPGTATGMILSNAYGLKFSEASCVCNVPEIEPVFCATATVNDKPGEIERHDWYHRDGLLRVGIAELLLTGRLDNDGAFAIGMAEAPNSEVALLTRLSGRIQRNGVLEGASAITANMGGGNFCNLTASFTGEVLWDAVDDTVPPAGDAEGQSFAGEYSVELGDVMCGCPDASVAGESCAPLEAFAKTFEIDEAVATQVDGALTLAANGNFEGGVSASGAFATRSASSGMIARLSGVFDAPGPRAGFAGLLEVGLEQNDCKLRVPLAGLRR
jgi:hypothetical protein